MGKGDKKSKKGKIAIGSYGVKRPKKKTSTAMVAKAIEKKPKASAKTAAKPAAKKTTKKKTEE
jgi:ribosomal small subunit protein bTHX